MCLLLIALRQNLDLSIDSNDLFNLFKPVRDHYDYSGDEY